MIIIGKNKSHVGEVLGIYKVIEKIINKDKPYKNLYLVQCEVCNKIFERNYSSISGKKITKTCRHNNKKYEDVDLYCKQCGKLIDRGNKSLSEYHKMKFCSQSCSATFNNTGRVRTKKKYCLNCGKELSGKGIYCSVDCFHDAEYKNYIKDWKEQKVSGLVGNAFIDTSTRIRKYLFEKYGNKCARCGWSEMNQFTGKIPLEIEHIDGNALNNVEDNLILLCPNCHSLTKTYRGANKGHGARNIKWLSRSGTTNL